jgi:L-aminopeptidase/D-esterase-like protein
MSIDERTARRGACTLRRALTGLLCGAVTWTGGQVAFAQGTGITAVPGVKVGHQTLDTRPTGCTVVVVEAGAVAGVDVRGGGPATRETDLLDPVNSVQQVHAISLSGGSAFGLDTASGVMRYLEERGIGFATPVARVPIVPAASLFDLFVGDASIRPTAECGYKAAAAATTGPVTEGDVGAGAGATVGKLAGAGRAMKAGIGTAAITLDTGIVIGALVAVNALGDIIDPSTGRVVAGARTEDGRGLADARVLVRRGAGAGPIGGAGQHTTIGVVATNATLTKAQAAKLAQMAHDGLARAVYPSHMPFDGDTLFALATGTHAGRVDLGALGALAADVVAEAILRAATQSKGLPGLPSASGLASAGAAPPVR